MRISILSRLAGVAFLAICLISPVSLFAQAQTFDASFVAMDEASGERHRVALEMLETALEAKGFVYESDSPTVYFIGVSNPDEEGKVALSITKMHRLDERAVELGKKDQVFFKVAAQQDPETHPEEGKWVREYVSESYMRQFAMVNGSYVEVVAHDALATGINGIVEKLIALP
ncbi:MAG: hypothetical protein AAF564_07860 [Bacteroidota bacterium]